MTVRCMIVDDEPLARELLAGYIGSLPSLEIAAQCRDAAEAAAFLHGNEVDLVFLDVRMPGLTGLELLETLSDPPLVIITTAHSEYALDGYEHAVVDYLLKPVPFERFLKAVDRAVNRLAATRGDTAKLSEFTFLRSDRVEHKISLASIRYLEGYGNYVKVHTDVETILVSETMKEMERRLPGTHFIRAHKSFIVSIGYIDRVEGDTLVLGKTAIPIGKHYRKGIERAIERHRL